MQSNLDLLNKRLNWWGGPHQEDRMIKDKWRSLQRALLYSYQACTIAIAQWHDQVLSGESDPIDDAMTLRPQARALINPDKVKQDYDDKILSLDYKYGLGPGDVFEWKKTGTYWIIYTRQITEDAYLRGEIRRCKYKIKFKDSEGNWCATWAAIRGPVETQINSIQKNQIRVDEPNLSLDILMPKNEKTLAAFERYKEFLLDGRCWRVEAFNGISLENVLKVNAEEYYIDRDTDDVEQEMKNGLVVEPVFPHMDEEIQGDTFIRVMIPAMFSAPESDGKWSIRECGAPVSVRPQLDGTVEVTWTKLTQGQFTLVWSKDDRVYEKTVVAESLL